MYCFRILLFCLLAVCTVKDARATVFNRNPNLTIAIVDDENFTLRPSGTTQAGMAVRLTDSKGLPMAGLTIDFNVSIPLCPPIQSCSFLPRSAYGLFDNGLQYFLAETDANGVARSGVYTGGTTLGTYQIEAWVFSLRSQKNRAALGGETSPFAYFAVTQSSTSVDGHMSGNWYDPARSGQGIQLEFTDQNNTAIAVWFVFGPDGGQNWIYAQGTYDSTKASVTLQATMKTGARFPPLFKPSDVQSTSWGSITLAFTDCNNGTLSWNSTLPGYAIGSMPLSRLTSIRGTKCPP